MNVWTKCFLNPSNGYFNLDQSGVPTDQQINIVPLEPHYLHDFIVNEKNKQTIGLWYFICIFALLQLI